MDHRLLVEMDEGIELGRERKTMSTISHALGDAFGKGIIALACTRSIPESEP